MPESAQADLSDVRGAGALEQDFSEFRHWKPEAQHKALSLLRATQNQQYRPFYCKNVSCNGQPHLWPLDERECANPFGHDWIRSDPDDKVVLNGRGLGACKTCKVPGAVLDAWTHPHARKDQRPPRWSADWLTLLLRGGRGSGKTRTGAEITTQVTEKVARITLVAPTGPDFRAIMIEGESGLLACSPPANRPLWEPSKKQLTWPNGCVAQGYSAEEPDRLRGQNSGYIWADEPSHWDLVEQCWSNMLFGLRKGQHPKIVATSTPKPTKWTKETAADPLTVDRVVSSYQNMTNLSDIYRRSVLEPKEGTRLGRQELYGEILADVEGALWNWDMMHHIEEAPPLQRIVVSIDPAGTANKRSDLTGIIVLGISKDRIIYVLADYSGKYSPEQWATKALNAAEDFSADAIVAEKNYGGDMVRANVEQTAKDRPEVCPRIILVTSRKGKDVRAEPIVGMYERVKVYHVGDRARLAELEDEQTSWVPHESPSPNRVDALVHGATELSKGGGATTVSTPAKTLADQGFELPYHLRQR